MISGEANLKELMRLADASLNRLAEGLRYLEDVCRFAINEASLNQRLKNMRHEFTVSEWESQKALIEARDADGDVGASLEVPANKEVNRDLTASVVANCRRVQEALRSLEEAAKVVTITPKITSANLQQARFEMYTIEKEILGKISRRDKVKQIRGLYIVIDTEALRGRSHLKMTEQAIRGGAKIIQLRDKTMDRGQLLPIALEMKALAVKADGVHLGQTDLPVKIVRQMVSIDMLIGASINSVKTAKEAQADGADYIAVSGVYATTSKDNVKPLGTGLVKRVRSAVDLPLAAIGGIKIEQIAELKRLGVDAVAVISAVLGAKSPETAARQFSKELEER
jgi:thiamine-phosphate pyrophosphorylase